MPKVDPDSPQTPQVLGSSYSLMEFMKAFPDDEACLQWLWRTRFSPDGEHVYCAKCKQERVFKRYTTKQRRFSWTCTGCGRHKSATAGTIYEGSATSLHQWFYAGYLLTSTRSGISAKQLEREIGVTYKCAWRMLNKLRNIAMADDVEPLRGDVEIRLSSRMSGPHTTNSIGTASPMVEFTTASASTSWATRTPTPSRGSLGT